MVVRILILLAARLTDNLDILVCNEERPEVES